MSAPGALIAALLLGLPVQESQPTRPAPPVAEAAAQHFDGMSTADFLFWRERLFAAHSGKWIAIADSLMIPPPEHSAVKPFSTFDECVRAADAARPSALHRYVFRIGEEGEIRYSMSTPISTNAIGGGILKQLHVDAWSVVNDHLSWTIAGKTHRFATDDADGLRVDLDVTDPAGAIASSVRVVVSGSFDGMLVLEPDAAARLHLERFEIPGTAVIDRGSHRIECRRARVRVRLPDVGVDALVPVAIWPR